MIDIALRYIIPAAYAVLPEKMRSDNATAQMLAIGLQESQFLHRHQRPRRLNGPPGPANGLWQFERTGGIKGVMQHEATREPLNDALRRLRYGHLVGQQAELHALVADNDIVAAVFARLNLWWLPARLPHRNETLKSWKQYLEAWRPGEPHPDTWGGYFVEAWHRVDQLQQETETT